jgi:hypothetical protein
VFLTKSVQPFSHVFNTHQLKDRSKGKSAIIINIMVSKLSSSEIIHFLLILLIILIPARLLASYAAGINCPAIIGEIFAGIIVGPTLLGLLFPGLFKGIFISTPHALRHLTVLPT